MESVLMGWWERTRRWPAGSWVFNRLLGLIIPYSGTIRAHVLHLEPGHSRVCLRDRRRVRNHLRSVHAVALLNLAELSTGLAMTAGLTDRSRAILTGLSMEYFKKARGRLVAECHCGMIDASESKKHLLESEIRNEDGEVVARGKAEWLVGPKPTSEVG